MKCVVKCSNKYIYYKIYNFEHVCNVNSIVWWCPGGDDEGHLSHLN